MLKQLNVKTVLWTDFQRFQYNLVNQLASISNSLTYMQRAIDDYYVDLTSDYDQIIRTFDSTLQQFVPRADEAVVHKFYELPNTGDVNWGTEEIDNLLARFHDIINYIHQNIIDWQNMVADDTVKDFWMSGQIYMCDICSRVLLTDGISANPPIVKIDDQLICSRCEEDVKNMEHRDRLYTCVACGSQTAPLYKIAASRTIKTAKSRWMPLKVFDVAFSDFQFLCPDCARSDNYVLCTHCNSLIESKNSVTKSITNLPETTHTYCKTCVKKVFKTCLVCRKEEYHDVGRSGTCHKCFHNSTGYHTWNYHPMLSALITSKEKPTNLLFGTEWELWAARYGDVIEEFTLKLGNKLTTIPSQISYKDLFYGKHDGSITQNYKGRGIEIVFSPMSWQFYKKLKRAKFWTEWFEQIGKMGFTPHARQTGFHVHLSRAPFTKTHLYKFGMFFYATPVTEFWLKLSERRSQFLEHVNRYCRFSFTQNDNGVYFDKKKYELAPELYDDKHSFAKEIVKPDVINDYRYVVCNFTNKHTIEVRLFTGPRTVNDFYAIMEVLYGVYLYTKNCPISTVTDLNHFINYITYQCKLPNAIKMIKERTGLCA